MMVVPAMCWLSHHRGVGQPLTLWSSKRSLFSSNLPKAHTLARFQMIVMGRFTSKYTAITLNRWEELHLARRDIPW